MKPRGEKKRGDPGRKKGSNTKLTGKQLRAPIRDRDETLDDRAGKSRSLSAASHRVQVGRGGKAQLPVVPRPPILLAV